MQLQILLEFLLYSSKYNIQANTYYYNYYYLIIARTAITYRHYIGLQI